MASGPSEHRAPRVPRANGLLGPWCFWGLRSRTAGGTAPPLARARQRRGCGKGRSDGAMPPPSVGSACQTGWLSRYDRVPPSALRRYPTGPPSWVIGGPRSRAGRLLHHSRRCGDGRPDVVRGPAFAVPSPAAVAADAPSPSRSGDGRATSAGGLRLGGWASGCSPPGNDGEVGGSSGESSLSPQRDCRPAEQAEEVRTWLLRMVTCSPLRGPLSERTCCQIVAAA
jgi:hypothetical protein